MIDHIGLNVPDLGSAKSYYDNIMPSLGYEPFFATNEQFSYRPAGEKPGTMVASQTPGREKFEYRLSLSWLKVPKPPDDGDDEEPEATPASKPKSGGGN